jgi:hypothetical protein
MRDSEIDLKKGEHTLRVYFEWSKPVPARTNCSNDNAHPAEGGLEGITSIALVRKGKERVLPEGLIDALVQDCSFIDDVNQAIADEDQANRESAEEDRYDEMREREWERSQEAY